MPKNDCTIEHLWPSSLCGPANSAAHAKCNTRKGDKYPTREQVARFEDAYGELPYEIKQKIASFCRFDRRPVPMMSVLEFDLNVREIHAAIAAK